MRRLPPRTHPAPLASELWRHLEKIRARRRKKKTWEAITKDLEKTCGLKLSAGTVRNFFKRASKRIPLERDAGVQARGARVQTAFMRAEIASTSLDDDPFSTKVVPFDPWKPQTKARAS
jgi:hypothetical protein